jgi:hypothetical protein
MYDLANEDDRAGDKSPDKRVDLIMQRLNKDKDSKKNCLSFSLKSAFQFFSIDVIRREEFIQGCLRDEFLRKILAPNTALLPGGQNSTTTNVPINATTTTSFNETGAAV